MTSIKKGQIVTMKSEYLEPGEESLPHIATEDSFDNTVRVEVAGEYKYRIKPISEWDLAWIAE